ncbi:MAG: hypothetical protein R3B47_18770 [Bacteroidia bacterium]
MYNKVTITKVKCEQPSSGTFGDGVFEAIGAGIGGAIGVVGGISAIAVGLAGEPLTAGGSTVLVLAGAGLFLGGAPAGAAISLAIKRAITEFSDGEDDLYIKVDGTKVYPGGDSVGIEAQEIFDVNKTFELSPDGIEVKLYDYDMISSDDLLHSFMIYPDEKYGVKVEKLDKGADGSIYTLYLDFH